MRGTRSWAILILAVSLVLLLVAAGCSNDGGDAPAYKDGSFTGTAQGSMWVSSSTVTLTMKDGQIVDVQIEEKDRDENVKDIAVYEVCVDGGRDTLLSEAHPAFISQLKEKNDWNIDGFTGASESTAAIKDAAKAALQSAKAR